MSESQHASDDGLAEIRALCKEIKIDVAKTQLLIIALAGKTGISEGELRQIASEKKGWSRDMMDPSPVEVDPET